MCWLVKALPLSGMKRSFGPEVLLNRLMRMYFQIDPAGGLVDGQKQITTSGFIRHLWQIKARFIVFEASRSSWASCLIVGPLQSGARQPRIEKFTGHNQQVIQPQTERLVRGNQDFS